MLNGLRMAILSGFLVVATTHAQGSGNRYINPPGLVKPTGYTHVVLAADRRTVYIAGQVALDKSGKLVGEGDMRAQLRQVCENIGRALRSVASPKSVAGSGGNSTGSTSRPVSSFASRTIASNSSLVKFDRKSDSADCFGKGSRSIDAEQPKTSRHRDTSE